MEIGGFHLLDAIALRCKVFYIPILLIYRLVENEFRLRLGHTILNYLCDALCINLIKLIVFGILNVCLLACEVVVGVGNPTTLLLPHLIHTTLARIVAHIELHLRESILCVLVEVVYSLIPLLVNLTQYFLISTAGGVVHYQLIQCHIVDLTNAPNVCPTRIFRILIPEYSVDVYNIQLTISPILGRPMTEAHLADNMTIGEETLNGIYTQRGRLIKVKTRLYGVGQHLRIVDIILASGNYNRLGRVRESLTVHIPNVLLQEVILQGSLATP